MERIVLRSQISGLYTLPETRTDQPVLLELSREDTSNGLSRILNLSCCEFSRAGDSLLISDHVGHVYLFRIVKGNYKLVLKVAPLGVTCISYKLRTSLQCMLALSDCSLRVYNLSTGLTIGHFKGHDSAISCISVHSSGRYAVSSSLDTAILWDLVSMERRRRLNVKAGVGIVKVCFLPNSNTLVAAFRDDSIFAWEADTLESKFQLERPSGTMASIKDFDIAADGRNLLAISWRTADIYQWTLDVKDSHNVIVMPKSFGTSKQVLTFSLAAKPCCIVLSKDGIAHFIDLQNCSQFLSLGSKPHVGKENKLSKLFICENYIAAITFSGTILLYSRQSLFSTYLTPPAPVVRLLKTSNSDKKHKTKYLRPESPVRPGVGLKTRLYGILRAYGEFPAKYRAFIWRTILELPENHESFAALVDKGTHPAFERLQEVFPVKNSSLFRVFKRVLSALAHWSPVFAEAPYLPLLVFPFVKLFRNNLLLGFELISSFLVNWGRHWFEFFPNPPVNILSMVENLLGHFDKELLAHLTRYSITSQTYAWSVLETVFSEVFLKGEWLILMDHVLANHPGFLVYLTAAYSILTRGSVLRCTELEDFEYLYHNQNPVSVNRLVDRAYLLWKRCPRKIDPARCLEGFVPLTRGLYPLFNKYPKFVVDFQAEERDKLRRNEIEVLDEGDAAITKSQSKQRRRIEAESRLRQQQTASPNPNNRSRRRQVLAMHDDISESAAHHLNTDLSSKGYEIIGEKSPTSIAREVFSDDFAVERSLANRFGKENFDTALLGDEIKMLEGEMKRNFSSRQRYGSVGRD